MKIIEIQEHLRKTLPVLDSKFNTKKTIDSVNVTSNSMNINSIAHGLSNGDVVTISGIEYVHEVDLVGKVNPVRANFTSDEDIDFNNDRDADKIFLESVNTYYNGEKRLISFVGNRTFQIQVDRDAPNSTTNKIEVVEKDLCYFNDTFTVSNVLDSDNFSVETNFMDTSDLRGGEFYNINKDIRIYSTVEIDQAMDRTLNQNDPTCLFVSASTGNVSRSRDIKTDATQRIESGSSIQMDTWEELSVFVIIKTNGTVDPAESQDYARNELRRNLIKCLMGYQPSSVYDSSYDFIYFDGDNFLTYNTGYYVHQYNFGVTLKLNMNDAYSPKSCPLKSIKTTYIKDGDIKSEDTVTFNNQ